MQTTKKIGFVGLGLIGGSVAKAIRQYYPDYEIIAFDKFLCAPISYNTAYLKQLKNHLHNDYILTDVRSVKSSIQLHRIK